MNYFKRLDLFGQKLSFTLFHEDKFKTIFGSLLSITIIILSVMFFVLFGSDLFYKENPLVNFQTVIQNNYSKHLLNKDNFFLPWGLFDDYGNILNTTGYIYPQINYYSFVLDDHGNFTVSKSYILNYTYCDKKYEKFIPQVSSYFCIDFDSLNLTFGGGFDSTFVDYFYLSINYCPHGNNYAPNSGCPTLKELNDFLNNRDLVYFQFFYPSLNFQSNKENPLTIEYLQYYYQLSMPLNKINRFYFQQSVLFDDDGVILKNNKSSQVYSMNKINTDFTLFPTDFYYSNTTRSRIYTAYFYIGKNHDLYNRSYMKLQTLTATVGGFLNIIFILCSGLNKVFNTTFRNRKLINEIFDFYECDNSKRIQIQFESNNINMSQNFILKSLNEERKFENSHSEGVSKSNVQKQAMTQSNFGNRELNKKTYSLARLAHKNSLPGHFTILKFKYFGQKCCRNNRASILMEAFEIGLKKIKSRLDIIYYLKSLDVIDKLRTIFLNKEQNLALNFINKRNLLDTKVQEEFNDLHHSNESESLIVVDYFRNKISRNIVDRIDNELLRSLDFTLQKDILKKE